MFEAYKVSVTLALTDNVSRGLLAMTRNLKAADGHVGTLQKKLHGLTAMTAKGFGTGAALALPFAFAVTEAAKLQKEMLGIQLATGATTKQIDAMRGAIESAASVTMFSNIDVAKMAKTIGTGTTLTPDQVSSLLPVYAKFADVQMLLKGTPADESVKDAVRLAHTAGHYDARSLTEYLDLLNRMTMVIPGGLSEAGHALKYSQTVANTTPLEVGIGSSGSGL